MSLTVNALRKLQQSGAFPALPKQTDSTERKPGNPNAEAAATPKSPTSEDEPVVADSTDESELSPTNINSHGTDAQRIVQAPETTSLDSQDTTNQPDISGDLEPPISTEEDDEPSELFPHTWEEELRLPASDGDVTDTTLDPDDVDPPPSDETPLFQSSLPPQIDHIPSTKDEGNRPNETIPNNDTSNPSLGDSSLDIGPTDHPSQPLSYATEDAFEAEDDVNEFSTTTPQQQIEQSELFNKNEQSNEYDSNPDPTEETDAEIAENSIQTERTQSNENESSSLEPLITESINSLERILSDETAESAYGLSNKSDICENDLPSPDERINQSQTADSDEISESELDDSLEDASSEMPSDEVPSDKVPSDEVIRYTPVIETIDLSAHQESRTERLDTAEEINQAAPLDISESVQQDSSNASDESIQECDDDLSTAEEMDSEILPLNSDRLVEAASELRPSIHSFVSFTGQAAEPTAYENEIQENLAKPEFEERFTNLCDQLHTRLQYKLPNSLLMVAPLQTGRIADTLAHLSFVLGRDGRNIIMIDANLAEQGLTRRFDSIGQPGICDVITGAMQPHEVIRPTSIPGIQLIPCGDDVTGISRTPNSTTPQAVFEMIQALSGENCHLLCDVGSLDSTLALPFCVVFEAVLCVVSMRDLEVTSLRKAVQLVREYEIPVVGTVTTDGQI